MQDFAPFIPELLGTLSGPQTPGRKGHQAICLLLQNLSTSLTIHRALCHHNSSHMLNEMFVKLSIL